MFNRILLITIYILISTNLVFASQITIPVVWGPTDTVTNVKLNNNETAITAVVNGNLDNTNMAAGFKLFQSVASLPSPGTQGNIYFLTSDNSLNIDNGSAFLKDVIPSGTPATGYIPYYNSGWQLLAPGAQYLPLVSNGISSLPSYQAVDLTPGRGATGTLAIANGGTGQITAQAAVDALLPSQTSNSGKFLTTNGTASSWGTPTSPAMVLTSTTSIAAATASSNITIDPTKYYFVQVNLTTASASGTGTIIRFNADSGAGDYGYVIRGFNTSATAQNANSASATFILMIASGNNIQTNANQVSSFYIYPQAAGGTKNIQVQGRTVGNNNSAGIGYYDFYGTWLATTTASSFLIGTQDGVATITGTVYLYEIKQS